MMPRVTRLPSWFVITALISASLPISSDRRVASAIAVACFQREIQNDLRADMTADQLCHVMLAAIAAHRAAGGLVMAATHQPLDLPGAERLAL